MPRNSLIPEDNWDPRPVRLGLIACIVGGIVLGLVCEMREDLRGVRAEFHHVEKLMESRCAE